MSIRESAPASKRAWFHVDMDGLDAIYEAHGRAAPAGRDAFYLSAVDNALAFFAEQKVRATFFVIARDLENAAKREALSRIVAGGHHVASHSLTHPVLYTLDAAAKREEIFSSKRKIEDTLGAPCHGFRAPGYSIDFEALELVRDAGYRYDSSVFPTHEFRKRLGLERLFPEPFEMFPGQGLLELPLPSLGPGLPPFHPCYAFYLTRAYYRLGLAAFRRRHGYLTFLFHLTDFAARQRPGHGLLLDVFTNNFYSTAGKLNFLRRLMEPLRREFAFTTSEAFVASWPAGAPELMPRTVLGISTTHETGACIVRDGRILSAINEERLSRVKIDDTYPPKRSIREAIRLSGVEPGEIEAVAIAGLHWKDLLPQTLESLRRDIADYHSFNDYFPHLCRVVYRLFYLWRAMGYGDVEKFLEREFGIRPKVYYLEHHAAHAFSAHITGTAADSLCITADGVGDDVSITFSRCSGATVRRIETFFYPHSFGQFYTACTQILGFKAGRHEGKITGLAGFGKPDPELLRRVEGTFLIDDGGFRLNKRYYAEGYVHVRWPDLKRWIRGGFDVLAVDYRNYKAPLKRLLAGFSREDVAFAFQHLLEREMVRLALRHKPAGPYHVTLAGGLFANVKLNMALAQNLGAESVYCFPNMGDGGLCVGAALAVAGTQPAPVQDMYLGSGYGEGEIREALEARGEALRTARPQDMARAVAEDLARGAIVARFDGRMEFGPRALGNRSILYPCGDRTVNDWLNRRLRRTEFMPFAPICLWEDADEYFVLREGEKRATEFMTLVVPCTEKMRTLCPAAVHVDGTARPQLVRREINPGVHAILTEYKRLTGVSCLINTSFNMHEEPIIRSPAEAVEAFLGAGLDRLAAGPFLVSRAAATQMQADGSPRPQAERAVA